MNPWEILELEPDASRRDVKRAYARLIKECRPEDDPERFEQVRTAYEIATTFARARESMAAEATAEDSSGEPDSKTDESPGKDEPGNQTLVLQGDGTPLIVDGDVDPEDYVTDLEREVYALVESLVASEHVEQDFAQALADRPVDLRWSEVFERALFSLDPEDNELLYALASREFRWSESTRYGESFREYLYALEVGLKVRDELRIKAEQAPSEDYRMAARIMLREAPVRWEYQDELNNYGLQFYGTYGEYWNRLIYSEPLDTEPDSWSDSQESSLEKLGCVGMIAIIAIMKVGFRAVADLVQSVDKIDVNAPWFVLAGLLLCAFNLALYARLKSPTYS